MRYHVCEYDCILIAAWFSGYVAIFETNGVGMVQDVFPQTGVIPWNRR